MAAPVQTISYFARRLIQFEQKFARRDPAQLPEIAGIFRDTGKGLDDLVAAINSGSDLEPACTLLQALSPRLQKEVQREIGPPESDRLLAAWGESLHAEALQGQFDQSPDGRVLLEELEKAAILIRALANGLHVGAQAPP